MAIESAASDSCVFISFFFFQAEDGIRDLYVTGVQTCALPICLPVSVCRNTRQLYSLWFFFSLGHRNEEEEDGHLIIAHDGERSEERRVGKECRSRWWPYQ